jgi:hypothetical protein
MAPDNGRRAYKRELLLATALVAAGVSIAGFSVVRIQLEQRHFAQANPPLQGSPSAAPSAVPAESEPGGARPTTPAPEPARPDARAQQEGEKAALPAAPAEKMAAPIKEK